MPAGVQAGTPTQAAVQAARGRRHRGGAPCNVGIPIIGGAVSTLTNAACNIGSTIASGVGSIVSGVGNSILDAVAELADRCGDRDHQLRRRADDRDDDARFAELVV